MLSISESSHLQQDCGSQLVCEPVIENLCFRSTERKSNNLNLKEKYNVIQMIMKDKKKVREVAVIFNCGKTQIYDIMKHKDKIIEKYMVGSEYDKSKRKEHHSKYQDIDDLVFKWYLAAKAVNFPVSGPILKQKAKEAAELLKIVSFSASNGWLQSFRKRHSINFGASGAKVRGIHKDTINVWNVKSEECHRKINESWHNTDVNLVGDMHEEGNNLRGDVTDSMLRESNDVQNVESWQDEENSVEIWFEKMKEVIKGYDVKDIASVDKIKLFYSALPNDVSFGKEVSALGRHSKDWLSVIVIVFADGKIGKPLVIGRTETPNCFMNLKKDQLPVTWKANEKCCVTSSIFVDCLNNLNLKMKSENRKILLFLDNTTYQTRIHLSNVQLIYFPQNYQPWLQPLNNGILHLFKMNYRELMLKWTLANKVVGGIVDEINVLDAITFVNYSLKCIPEIYVQRCFKNCGFKVGVIEESADMSVDKLGEIENLIRELYKGEEINLHAEDFVNVDEILQRKEIDYVSSAKENASDLNSRIEDSEECCSTREMPSSSQVLQSLIVLKDFAKMKGENEFFDKVVELEFHFVKMKEFSKKKM